MHYTRDVNDILSKRPASAAAMAADHPSGYLPDQGLVDAVNVALILGKPLLLTGDPGTGKTQLAYSLAWQLAERGALNVRTADVEKFETKSTSLGRDLFYTFDAIRRFHAAPPAGDSGGTAARSNAPFITFNALGLAVLRAMRPERIPSAIPRDAVDGGPTRSVVLIDEIDKAPRDFPNDLLNEIEQMYFRLPELDNVIVGGKKEITPEVRPIVVITSNSEKNLPDPFLRRCVYHNIAFPEKTPLGNILLSRLSQLSPAHGALADDALTFFYKLRDGGRVKRKSSPAELIEWLLYLLKAGARPDRPLAEAPAAALAGLATLAKEARDQDVVRAELEAFLGIKPA